MLKYLEGAGPDLRFQYQANADKPVFDLRKQVDAKASRFKYLLVAIAVALGSKFLRKPPYIGKLLNIFEELWNIIKARGRVNLPIADRNNDSKVKLGLRKELVDVCKHHRLLQDTLLNSMRVCFAVMKAVFHGERVL